jgi:dTDP-4-amino-4,6-dideoxygalactose transaminase
MSISITSVRLGTEEEDMVLGVIRSGQLAQGPVVERLEKGFAQLAGVRHAVAVSNGTVALVAALRALGIGPGDEVLTSPFTFIATANAILDVGASVRFADIGLDDFCLDPRSVEARITPRTRAMVVVDLFGQPADWDPLMEIARAKGLAVVEDSCQAHGARYRGRPAGSFGTGCFSLYATKNLTTGEGGMVTTDDGAVAERVRTLRNQGMRRRYEYEMHGYNYRMTDLQAALGIPQLERLAEVSERRRRNAARLTEGLGDVPGIVVPRVMPGREHAWHQYTIRVTPDTRLSRGELQAALSERGVGSGVYYPASLNRYECYQGHELVDQDPMPATERASREVLSLPVHQHLSEGDVDTVVREVRAALHG